jgi:hypothetical protein
VPCRSQEDMERCEGYYRLENRRCDRSGTYHVAAANGEAYLVCAYHARQGWAASVARWHEDSGVRSSAPTDLRPGLDSAA